MHIKTNQTGRKPSRTMSITAMALILLAFPAISAWAEQYAVVATVAPDYSSGAHCLIDVDPIGGPRTARNDLLPTASSDISVTAYGTHFYRIERYFWDNVTKFDVSAPSTPIWQFSTMDDNDAVATSNPVDLVFVSETKAYLLRHNTTTAWIVNPSATTQADFKIGTLDLSNYNDGDGYGPEMSGGVVVDGKLFIMLQRLDQSNDWVPETAYVAVFDTTTDTEIDTQTLNADGVIGVALPIKNPGAIQYLAETGLIYVQGYGDWNYSWYNRENAYSGGIISIDPDTYDVNLILDDGPDGNDAEHPYGFISGMALYSSDIGYFVGYAGYQDNTLYAFDPESGVVSGSANPYLAGKDIAAMESGSYFDQNGMLWVCNGTDSEVVVIDPMDNSIDEQISTNLDPKKIVFVSTESTAPGEGGSGSSGGGGGGCFINTLKTGDFGSVQRGWAGLAILFIGVACVFGRVMRKSKSS